MKHQWTDAELHILDAMVFGPANQPTEFTPERIAELRSLHWEDVDMLLNHIERQAAQLETERKQWDLIVERQAKEIIELHTEHNKVLEAARKAKRSRDVHSVYEVLDWQAGEIERLREIKRKYEAALSEDFEERDTLRARVAELEAANSTHDRLRR